MAFTPDFLAGFEDREANADQINEGKWWLDSGTYSYVTTPTFHSAYALEFNMSAATAHVEMHADITAAGRWGGTENNAISFAFHLNIETLPTSGLFMYLFRNQDTSVNHGRCRINDSGQLEIVDSGGTIRDTSSALSTGTWYFIVVFQDTTNGTTVKIYDTDTDLIVDTIAYTGEKRAPHETFLGPITTSTGKYQIDNVMVQTGGLSQNPFDDYGTSRLAINPIVPTGAGADTDQDSGVFSDVDEFPNDGNTTYVQSDNSPDPSNSTFVHTGTAQLTSQVKTIHSVQVNLHSRWSASSVANTGLRWRQGSTVINESTMQPSSTIFQWQGIVRDTDPDAAAWTAALLDSLEFGFYNTGNITRTARFSNTWLEVLYSFGGGMTQAIIIA